MKVGLIDVDGHNYPNLALMKISAWHKSQGDVVEWWNGLMHYDRVYKAKVFDETYTKESPWCINADEIISGGTGYGLDNRLPDYIEHICPDYGLYGIKDTAYGFLTRGCPRGCPFCIVAKKEGRRSVQVAELDEFWRGQKYIELLDPNLLACKDSLKLLKSLEGKRVNFNQGLDCRVIAREHVESINKIKLTNIHFAWDHVKDEKAVVKGLETYSMYAERKVKGAWGMVYVLTNYGSTIEEDLYRIEKLRSMNYDPYVMIYDKPHAPREIKRLQRWCNSKWIFKSCKWEEYR